MARGAKAAARPGSPWPAASRPWRPDRRPPTMAPAPAVRCGHARRASGPRARGSGRSRPRPPPCGAPGRRDGRGAGGMAPGEGHADDFGAVVSGSRERLTAPEAVLTDRRAVEELAGRLARLGRYALDTEFHRE